MKIFVRLIKEYVDMAETREVARGPHRSISIHDADTHVLTWRGPLLPSHLAARAWTQSPLDTCVRRTPVASSPISLLRCLSSLSRLFSLICSAFSIFWTHAITIISPTSLICPSIYVSTCVRLITREMSHVAMLVVDVSVWLRGSWKIVFVSWSSYDSSTDWRG